MQKSKIYPRARFSAEVLKKADAKLLEAIPQDYGGFTNRDLTTHVGGAEWTHDSEDEFYADYRKGGFRSTFSRRVGQYGLTATMMFSADTEVTVTAPARGICIASNES